MSSFGTLANLPWRSVCDARPPWLPRQCQQGLRCPAAGETRRRKSRADEVLDAGGGTSGVSPKARTDGAGVKQPLFVTHFAVVRSGCLGKLIAWDQEMPVLPRRP